MPHALAGQLDVVSMNNLLITNCSEVGWECKKRVLRLDSKCDKTHFIEMRNGTLFFFTMVSGRQQ